MKTFYYISFINYELVKIQNKLCNNRFCEDGYADIVESKDKAFYICVRFHQESLYKTDENTNNIFKNFIETCKSKKV